MRRLVALDMAGDAGFVAAMRRVHDAGDAVLPVDQRLPAPAKIRVLEALRPAVVVGADGDETKLAAARPIEEGDAYVVATSGTTGEPRGVVLTHDAVTASACAVSTRLGVDPARDKWLCCLPLAHVGGLAVVTRALATGTPLEVQPVFAVGGVTSAAARGATLVSLVPTTCARLGAEAARFRTIVLGGGPMPNVRPRNAVATYGMTETGSGVVYDGWPLDGVEIRIAAGGEIVLRGPMLLRAYRFGDDPKDADGWFRTGDAGMLSPQGQLEVFGRMADVIRTGGESVWPVPVEAVLRAHPGVAEVVIVGVPDPEWGERVVAVVETTDASPPTLDELRELVRGELGPIAAPKELVLVPALPRTGIGKVRRDTLKRALAEGDIGR
ncbi:MAG TPA: AMP-binding protein [Acidimicrobiales bacterium]|nr:AMP-binding protein [Acidimicrobiales bacterium]